MAILKTFDFTGKLMEYWEGILDSSPKLLFACIVFLIFFFIGFLLKRTLKTIITRRATDPLLAMFIGRIALWGFIVLGFVTALKIVGLGSIAGGLLAGAGVGAFIIGFAFKDIGENLLAGVMLAFSRPFRVGDTVETNGVIGKVVALDLRNTHLKTPDGKDVYIPNSSIIKNNMVNYTIDGFMRYHLDFGIDAGVDISKSLSIANKVLGSIDSILHTEGKAPTATVSEMGTSALILKTQFWIDTFNPEMSAVKAKQEIIIRLIKAFEEHSIYLPGDVVELKNYNNIPLAQESN